MMLWVLYKFVYYVDIVDKYIYNIIVKILQTPSRDEHTHHKGGKNENKIT